MKKVQSLVMLFFLALLFIGCGESRNSTEDNSQYNNDSIGMKNVNIISNNYLAKYDIDTSVYYTYGLVDFPIIHIKSTYDTKVDILFKYAEDTEEGNVNEYGVSLSSNHYLSRKINPALTVHDNNGNSVDVLSNQTIYISVRDSETNTELAKKILVFTDDKSFSEEDIADISYDAFESTAHAIALKPENEIENEIAKEAKYEIAEMTEKDLENAIKYFRYKPSMSATCNDSTEFFEKNIENFRKLTSEDIKNEIPGKWYYVYSCEGYAEVTISDTKIDGIPRKNESTNWHTENDLFIEEGKYVTIKDYIYDIGNGYYLMYSTYGSANVILEPQSNPYYKLYTYEQKDRKSDTFAKYEKPNNSDLPSNTQISSPQSSSGNNCIVDGCNKTSTYSVTGLNGSLEYYCDEHYKEMQDILNGMLSNSKSSTTSATYSEKVTDDDRTLYWTIAENEVKKHLKSPRTAKFPFSSISEGVDITKAGDTVTVKSYVDAQNSVGAEVRTYFTVKIKLNGTKYSIESCIID
ncbi:hypothetical protein SAMN04487928_11761 [Butyrivibrio proteoclasticus]|uniref:Lipoprotein n=1 Tax=Butyrivibrio proteoclasticus TaxID=43305 RepID=A0A1I5VIG4_9FIRM|nr:hypothetical protein [Butyrivibrio proteoclasticus]SFQ07305.1 hypothetical protein SAMN04487928_11761 [Butyrivibrio proteoclasticus]